MKKFLSLIIAVMFGFVLNAQTTKTEAADFTSFDSYGNEIHLFDILEGGQYVLLHLTIEGEEDTPIVTPPMVEAYKALGCNQHDVFFIGVNANGTANSTQEFIDEYGIEYPMIHNDNNTGSNTAVSIWQYYVCLLPTTILIAPDKSIVLNDIYPIEEAATIINALAEFDIQEYECGEEPEPDPEPEDGIANFIAYDDQDERIELFEILDRGQYAFMYFFFSDTDTSPIFTPVMVEAYETLGSNAGEIFFIGIAPGDDSLSVANWKKTYGVEFPVVHALAKGETDAHDICDSYGTTEIPRAMLISPDRQIVIDNVFNKVWPLTSAQELYDAFEAAGVTLELAEMEESRFNVYPNPASSIINIKSDMTGKADVRIYDMAGRCVKKIRVSDIGDATIDISDIETGVYIVNVNGKMTKLVVE